MGAPHGDTRIPFTGGLNLFAQEERTARVNCIMYHNSALLAES